MAPPKSSAAAPAAPGPPATSRPKPLPRLLRAVGGFLGRHLLRICWLTYALGLAWVLLHPAATVSTGESKPRGTYISENALLVDSFEPRCSHAEALAAREYQREFAALPRAAEGYDLEPTLAWLEAQLRALDRVTAHRHRFAVGGSGATHANVYGILRAAPLADGKESIVLVAHYRSAGADSGEYSGVALGLALLRYLVDAKWLAKDVVLLFADDGPLDGSDGFAAGTEAWLQAYHMDPLQQQQQQQQHEELPMRAGVIRAALTLETRGRAADANVMGVLAAGINGQLPNLDLVNTAVLALHGEHVPVALDRCTGAADEPCSSDALSRAHAWLRDAVEAYAPAAYQPGAREYLENLRGMLRFMQTLATGPGGAHAHFIRHNIDSVTLSALSRPHSGATVLSLRALLRSLEKVVRSLSNLEEKLHQSFFLYVLPNTRHFVSVGEYYYVVALAVSPAIAHMAVLASRTVGMRLAFSLVALLLVELGAAAALATAPGVFASDGGSAVLAWGFVLAVTGAQAAFVAVALPLLRSVSVISGCAERREWRVLVRTYEEKHKGEDKKKKDGAAAAAPPPIPLQPEEILASIPQQDSGWRGMKFIVMILLVYAHCILGIINYPMAFFCAVPMSLFALVEPLGATKSGVKRAWCALWLLASSPIALFVAGMWLHRDGALHVLDSRGFASLTVGFAAGFVSSLAYAADSFALRINLLTLPYACCLYLPVHTLSLGVWLFPISREAEDELAVRAKKTN